MIDSSLTSQLPSSEILDKYAAVIVKDALNLQRGQNLLVRSEPFHQSFVERIVEAAREIGAGKILTYYYNREAEKQRIETESLEQLAAIIPELQEQGDWIADTRGGSIYIAGATDPHFFEGVDGTKLNALERAKKRSLKHFFDVLGSGQLQWTLGCAATPLWGKLVYPELSEEEAYATLWSTLLRINAIDLEDPAEYWKTYTTAITDRANAFNAAPFSRLHFRGPNTDLIVGLSPRSNWEAGLSTTDQGISYYANRPSFEIFTAPDRRVTNGRVKLTLPAEFNRVIVRDAEFEFKDGRVVEFSASSGAEALEPFLSTDEGSNLLGEIALVGMDNPLSQEDRVFYDTLLDENSRCHFAFGRAYESTVRGFEDLDDAGKSDIGFNKSDVHQDVMISDAQTDVDGITFNGDRIAVIRSGLFVI